MTTREIVNRALRTFVQAFVATTLAGLAGGEAADLATWQRAAVAGLAAGLSAAWNVVRTYGPAWLRGS